MISKHAASNLNRTKLLTHTVKSLFFLSFFKAHSSCQHQTLLMRGANEKAKLSVHGAKP